jgi:hypothetical protein
MFRFTIRDVLWVTRLRKLGRIQTSVKVVITTNRMQPGGSIHDFHQRGN